MKQTLAMAVQNKWYAEQQNAERARRKAEGLVFTSNHGPKGHFETQEEFRKWFKTTFPSVRGLDLPIWSGGSSRTGIQQHTWLMHSKEQMMLAKLTWG